MKLRRRQRLLRRLVFGLVAAAIAVPSAAAETSWYLGQGLLADVPAEPTIVMVDGLSVDRSGAPATAAADDRTEAAIAVDGLSVYASGAHAQAFDRTPVSGTADTSGKTSGGSEFSWRDAGIGAGTIAALLGIAAGAAGALRFRRGGQQPA